MQKLLTHIEKSQIPESVQLSMDRVLSAALDAVSPVQSVTHLLSVKNGNISFGNHHIPLNSVHSIRLLAFGKAAQRMAAGAVEALSSLDIELQGLVIPKHIDSSIILPKHFEIVAGGHPIPNQASVIAGKKAAEFVKSAQTGDLVLCLISGGGSALMSLPVEEVSLEEVQQLTKLLLACGAEIQEINALRKHLDQVKGGGIARFAQPARVISLILSDVIGNPLDSIASGPTVPDPSTFTLCLQILEKYQITNSVPNSILNHLRKGSRQEIQDTPKAGNPIFKSVINLIIGSNYDAAQAALNQARQLEFNTLLLTTYLKGEAHQAGQVLANILQQIESTSEPLPRPCCIVCGGETTVTLSEKHGLGGRNLELALGAVKEMDGIPNAALISLATDGEDGPTDAAGAVVTGATYANGLQAGLSLNQSLTTHNSYDYFKKVGGLIQIGSTGTNVNDLVFLFAW
jgi:hydroxypyruvate reductase